jgi:hypothetical protein
MTLLTKCDSAHQGASKFDVLCMLLSKGISITKSIIGKLYYTISIHLHKNYGGSLRIPFVISGVIDTADHQKFDFIVEYCGGLVTTLYVQ